MSTINPLLNIHRSHRGDGSLLKGIINMHLAAAMRYIKGKVNPIKTIAASLLLITVTPFAQAQNDTQGIAADEIRIGSSLIMSGPLKNFGLSFKEGADIYLNQVNAAGGVHGRKITYIVKDDGYQAEKSKQNVRELLDKDKVFMLFGMQGTPAILATIPIAEQEGVPNLAPYSGNDGVHSPNNKTVFTTIASYSDEVNRGIAQMTEVTLQDVAVVYQNNAFGQPLFKVAQERFKHYKRNVVAEASVETDGSNAKKAAEEIAAKDPKAILLITAGTVTSNFIHEYFQTGKRSNFYLLSVADVEHLRGALKENVRGIVIAQTLPPPWIPKIPLVVDYRRVYTNLLPNYSHFMGYVMARALVESLKAAGPDLSRTKYLSTLRRSRFDIGGYVLDFSKGQQGSTYVDMTMLNAAGRYVR